MINGTPQTQVTGAISLARVPIMSDVASVMRSDAARNDIRQQQPTTDEGGLPRIEDDKWRYNSLVEPDSQKYVRGGKVAGFDVDSDEAQRIVKNVNSQADLKINKLTEIASYMRWGTLGLMASSFAWLSGYLGISSAGAGAASAAAASIALPAAIAFGIAAVVVGAATLLVSQSAKKLQGDRWMDVQEFLQERNSVKIGKQVALSIGVATTEPAVQRADGKSWVEVAQNSAKDVQLSHI